LSRTPLAITYARALMELAAKADRLRPVLEEVRFLGGLYRENRDLRTFIEIPSIGSKEKCEALERIFRGRLDDLVLDFLVVAVQKNRQFLLPEIFAECEELYDQAVGRIHVKAITAVPLEPSEKEALVKAIEERVKGEVSVVLVNKVDPEVLGGLVLRYHDRVTDASIATALDEIARRLKRNMFGSELVHENQS
jgi:F-type H+-transporting ATPase subunit delta